MILKKRIPVVLIAVLLLTQLLATAAPVFDDVPDGQWYTEPVNRWGELLADGTEAGPGEFITRAEFAHVLNSVMKFPAAAPTFIDVTASTPYSADIGALQAAGVTNGKSVDGKSFLPDDTLTRLEAAILFTRAIAMELDPDAVSDFKDADSIPEWGTPYISALNENRYVIGDGGNFYPNDDMTRAEAYQVIDRLAKNYVETTDPVNEVDPGSMVVNVPDAVIEDVTIEGDLIVAPGVGEGEVTLNNVELKGTLYVRGGGANSIIITGTSTVTRVIVETTVATTSIRVEGASVVTAINVNNSGSSTINLTGTGTVTNVNVAGTAPVNAEVANITALNITSVSSTVTVAETTIIETVYVAPKATAANVSVEGTVTNFTNAAAASTIVIKKTAVIQTVTVTGSAAGSSVSNAGTVATLTAKAETVAVSNEGTITAAEVTSGTAITGSGAVATATTIETGSVNDVY